MKPQFIGVALFLVSSLAGAQFMPNQTLTPGAVASISPARVCVAGYAEASRNVSRATLKKVYEKYGIVKANCKNGCKVDHLVPLAIGGSNKITNLWPHEYGSEWTPYEKTRLEVRLRKEVCSGAMPILAAQDCIRTDWTKCYQHFYPGEHQKRLNTKKE